MHEIAALKIGYIDKDRMMIRVEKGKGLCHGFRIVNLGQDRT